MNSEQSTRFGKAIGNKIEEVLEREARSGVRYWQEMAGGPFLTWADRYTFEEKKYEEMLPLYLALDKRTIKARDMWVAMAWRKASSYMFRLYEWKDAGSVGEPPFVKHGEPVVIVG
jgi:hypothetical protein